MIFNWVRVVVDWSLFWGGVYTGYQMWAPYKGKVFMTERCPDCNGSGFELKIHNDVADCKSCGGCGHYMKDGFWYQVLKAVLKWTDI
jgi:hypothetical protein